MDNPKRFREISWRTISSHNFVVKTMLKAEMRANNKFQIEEKGDYYAQLAKEICKLGSIKLIDAMDENDLEEYIYTKYIEIVNRSIESARFDQYNKAIDLMNSIVVKDIKKAIKIFRDLNGYMDSTKMIDECNTKLNEIAPKKGIFKFLSSKRLDSH